MRLRLALIGYGGVNRALAGLLAAGPELGGHEFVVTAVTDPRFGCVYAPAGLDLTALAGLGSDTGALTALGDGQGRSNADLACDQAIDIVVEGSVTNPIDGEPALSLCRLALEAGKSVVTTNKGPVVYGLAALSALAARNKTFFRFEGAVMSGTPVLRAARLCFPGMRIDEFRGILNGTSNFMLGQMEAGADFARALREAQAAGYAEADPTADVEGGDVRLKVVILANLLFGATIVPTDVACRGITGLTQRDIEAARASGMHWKLIGTARRRANDAVEASVEPICLPPEDPLSAVAGATNALTLIGEPLGATTIVGPGAGLVETAYALLSDLIDVAGAMA